MGPKKGPKATVPVQIVPEKRGYEFGGPFVITSWIVFEYRLIVEQTRCYGNCFRSTRPHLLLCLLLQ
jgi:hypothetical protein